MNLSTSRAAAAAVAVAALAVVGCSSGATVLHGSSGAILAAADQSVLSGSVRATFSAQVTLDLSKVTPPSGISEGELALLQTEVDAARLTGVVEYQGPKAVEASFTLSPLLSSTWRVLDLNGVDYASEGGSWYRVNQPDSTAPAPLKSAFANLKQELKAWAEELRQQASVTNLGETTVAGQTVDHLRATLSGGQLDSAFAAMLGLIVGDLGSQGSALNSELPAIEKLVQFTGVTTDSYVSTSTKRLAKSDVNASASLDLGELSALDPQATGLPGGTASLTLEASDGYSDYGQDFGLKAPSHVASGPLPVPGDLGGLSSTT